MRAPLTIVIPILNAQEELGDTLSSLMEGLHAGLIRELIVSDGGSDDDTLEIARMAGAEIIEGPKGRGGQLMRGAERASGEWLLFLHADTHLRQGWSDDVARFISHEEYAGYGRLEFRDAGLWGTVIAGGANFRSRLFGLPYGDQGLLISRSLYAQIGGYRDIPLMEDVAIAKLLKRRLKPCGFTARTSAARYQQAGYIRRVLHNWVLLGRYKLGADPQTLADSYRK
ncbi:TIGR04283 family arsenosugar biosynthesis glycosyltransferase [Falsihalocynthiibacter sp. SS001]|uniref:TIGR04283 family arsenosugar biosynthesis glycosyltransferase n=1 Tax=Falsihalocynthiibacter sp. SS001 TaxID=3349698 RepID=UPI0036D3EBE0